MNRPLAILVTAAALTVSGTVQAAAVSAAAVSGTAVSGPVPGTCVTGYRGVVVNEICAVVSGDQVTFFGQSSPGGVGWTPRSVSYRMTAAVVGGAGLGSVSPTVLVDRSSTGVARITGTVPCGSTASATLETTQWGWPPATATVVVPAGC
ncbi:hypothetical protein ACFCX4_19335 [Kitasatospora sp. NPDC056327]|uniref:hypothetical protein n=1 Tax=Kitasatospora sp. NPDC056327 TaxID=3345785 RepID=UPI0035DD1FAC